MAHYEDVPYIVIERRSGGFAGLFWGAVLGAGLALLFAPRSGKETRRELQQGVQKLKSSAEDAMRQVQDAVTGALDDVRREVGDRVEAAREAVEAGREAVREKRAELEQRVRESQAAIRAGLEAAKRPPVAETDVNRTITRIEGEEVES